MRRACREIRVAVLALGALTYSGLALAQEHLPVEVVPQTGHSARITSVAFSPDGRTVLSGSLDNTLKLCDASTGMLLRTLAGHSVVGVMSGVTSVAFSPDGRTVLSGGTDRSLKLWDAETGKLLLTFEGHSSSVPAVAFAPDGRTVISGSNDKTLKHWDVSTGKLLSTFGGHSDAVVSVSFSPNGKTILSGGSESDRTLKLWDGATGKLLRTFVAHRRGVTSVAFSPDGRSVLSGSWDKTLRLWDAATGKLLRTFEGHSDTVTSVAFAPDGRTVLSGSGDETLKVWDVATGKPLQTFVGYGGEVSAVALSPDGRTVLSGNIHGILSFWDQATAKLLRSLDWNDREVASVAFSPDGRTVLLGSWDGTLRLWDTATGALRRSFEGHWDKVTSVAFSPDGRTVLSGSDDKTLKLWDTKTGALVRTFEGHSGYLASVTFSPDGHRVLSASWDKTLKLWDTWTGMLLRTFAADSYGVESVAFAPDGRTALSGGNDHTLKLWDTTSGVLVRTFAGHSMRVTAVAFAPDGGSVLSGSNDKTIKLWDTATGKLLRTFVGHSDTVMSVAFAPDGQTMLSASADKTLKLWAASTGKLLRTFEGHSYRVRSVAFAPDGRTAVSGGGDGTAIAWSISSGRIMARLVATPSSDWLAMTPEGFFAASTGGGRTLGVVRGLDAYDINQMYQSLYNADLVRETLAGDPAGEVQEAAKVMNLEKVLDSGPAPVVAITSHPVGSESAEEVVTIRARITDKGKGIGRIEWRVNGVTAAVGTELLGSGPDYNVSQQLALDPGDNTIEVVAYNGSNLLASVPARTMIKFTGSADAVKPTLHVLAIGINKYMDQGWKPPGSVHTLRFPPLKLAVRDATALSATLKKAGAEQYAEVKVTEALDSDATAAGLDRIVERMAGEIHPRDTFVLFAAAHGTSYNGRFYLIPQDYDGGTNPAALQERAIGQDRLQDWVANRIKAKKTILLLDTCESGALVGGYTRSRTDVPASEAAIGRLHEATGRPVLTAAAEGKPAFEGYEGHGVFTWTLLDALKNGDRNGNGFIELSELVAHVQDQVPKIAAKLNGRGQAAVAARGSADASQSARFGSRGEDFSVVQRLQ